MDFIKKILAFLWRIWFLIIAGLPIIILSPIILVSIIFDSLQPLFAWLKHTWGVWVVFWMGFRVKIIDKQKIDPKQSYIFISNHTSIMDIFLMLKLINQPFVFVGKESIGKLPIFGYLYKKSNVTVDRSSPSSKKNVYDQVEKFIKRGNSIVIYVEGGIPNDTSIVLDRFKTGAFRMAIEHQINIVPMVFLDNKRKFPYDNFHGSPGTLRVKMLPVISTKGLTLDDTKNLVDYTYTLMYNELMNDEINKSFSK